MDRRRIDGSSSHSSLALIALVAVVGASGVGTLGQSVGRSLTGATQAEAVPTPRLGSQQQAAFLSTVTDFARAVRRTADELPEGYLEDLKRALQISEEGDLERARAALEQLWEEGGAVNRAYTFADASETIERVSYEQAGRAAKELTVGDLAILREIFENDAEIGAHLRDVDRLANDLVRSVESPNKGRKAPQAILRAREAFVRLINKQSTRPLFFAAIDDDARSFSERFWQMLDDEGRILSSGDGEQVFYDQITVGAGPQGGHVAGVLADTHPETTHLVIEAGDSLMSSNFGRGGDMFRYNNSNRGYIWGALGNFANKLANRANIRSPINLSDLSWFKNGYALDYAHVGAAAVRASGADALVSTTVMSVGKADAQAPGKYVVRIGRTVNGQQEISQVFTDRVALATGVPEKKFPFDEETQRLINAELSTYDPESVDRIPRILTVAQALELQSLHPEAWQALHQGGELPDAVIGLGDSTYTFLATSSRSPNAGAPSDLLTAQVGEGVARRVDLFGAKTTDPQTLLLRDQDNPGLRGRYVPDIYANIVRAAEEIEAGEVPGPETFVLRDTKVDRIRFAQDGSVEVFAEGFEEPFRYNRVVLGTGVDTDVGPLLDDFVARSSYEGPLQKTDLLDVVADDGRVLSRAEVEAGKGVARKVKGEEIYVVGLAAGDDLIPKLQLAGIKENSAAIANWVERTERLVDRVFGGSRGIQRMEPSLDQRWGTRVVATSNEEQTLELATRALSARQRKRLGAEKEPLLALKYKLTRALSQGNFNVTDGSPIGLSISRSGNRLVLKANFEWSVGARKAIAEDDEIVGLMSQLVRRGDGDLGFAWDTYREGSAKFGFEPGRIRPGSVMVAQ